MENNEAVALVAQEVATLESNRPEFQILGMIERVAKDPTVDVDKLERMLALQERIMAKQNEMEFNQALSRIAEKMPRIVKEKGVNYTKEGEAQKKDAFRYATYETIDRYIRPLLIEEGMSLSYTTEVREGGGGANVTGTLSHRNGHSKSASIAVPLDTSGGKNNIQGMGSTYSYGRRYTMCMLLNIVTVGEDDDGQGGAITEEQAAEIKAGLKETGLDTIKFLKIMGGAPSVDDIKTRDRGRAMAAIDAQKWRQSQEKKGKENA